MDWKKDELLTKLLRKTEEGKVAWSESVTPEMFQTSLPNMTIAVFQYRGMYAVNILNSMDVVIEEISEDDVMPDYTNPKIKKLWEIARRKAYNVDEQINALMSSLDGL